MSSPLRSRLGPHPRPRGLLLPAANLLVAVVVLALLLSTMPAGAAEHTATDPAEGPQAGVEIVGGSVAAPGEFPYQVALLSRSVPDRYNAQFCGGSIISPTAVLTAAHCVESETASSIDILVGTVELGGSAGQRVPATQIHIHPQWNTNTSAWDVAIIEVATPLISAPVAVVLPGQESIFAGGTTSTVTGWGALSEGGGFPTRLHKVAVPMTSDGACAAAYGGGFDPSSMVCAGLPQGGKDSCQGDSGGPLAVHSGGRWVQVGVVSWGSGCARPNAPGVYSRISAMSSFISPYVGERVHPFSDVAAWLTDAVAWMHKGGYMTGFPDLTFRPGNPITRAQAVRVLWSLAGEPNVATGHGLGDVPIWIDAAVRWAGNDPDGGGPAQPVIEGYPDATFRPDYPITRGQWTRMLHRMAGEPAASQAHGFTDVASWVTGAVSWITDPARNPPYATGFGDGTYRANVDVTRGQATRMAFLINA